MGGGERSGVVVAERVGAAYSKQSQEKSEDPTGMINQAQMQTQGGAKELKAEEERIPNEMDKAGPDKA